MLTDLVRKAYWKESCSTGEGPNYDPKYDNPTWSELVDYIVQHHRNMPECKALYSIARAEAGTGNRGSSSDSSTPGGSHSQGSEARTRAKLGTNYWRQAYAAARGIQGAADSSDSRGLDLFNQMFDISERAIPTKALVCKLTSRGWSNSYPLLLPEKRFITRPSTTFEMVLFLMS